MAVSRGTDFKDLMLGRIGFAAAQATQNPISFSLIPDLFPNHQSTAMAAYNCAIYFGRALSFGAVYVARHRDADEASTADGAAVAEAAGTADGAAAAGAAATSTAGTAAADAAAAATTSAGADAVAGAADATSTGVTAAAATGIASALSEREQEFAATIAEVSGLDEDAALPDDLEMHVVPLDQIDIDHMSVVYTLGDNALVMPIYNYDYQVRPTAIRVRIMVRLYYQVTPTSFDVRVV